MKPWRLARSLIQLRDQINAASPNRNKVSDGALGDRAHASRPSDHNPNAQGVVCAIDVTHDPQHGVDGQVLSRWLTVDTRTKYVIFAGEIWKARTGKWEGYTGPNKHNHHVHISVTPIGADDVSVWAGIGAAHTVRPTLKLLDRGPEVARLQAALDIEADGQFGYQTEKAVKKFQAKNGLEADGRVGLLTWTALGL